MPRLKHGAKLPIEYSVTFPQLGLTGTVVEEDGVQYLNGYDVTVLEGSYYTKKKNCKYE